MLPLSDLHSRNGKYRDQITKRIIIQIYCRNCLHVSDQWGYHFEHISGNTECSVFHFEDVYITGLICRKEIGTVALEHKGFNCGYRNRGPCGNNFKFQITGHHYTPREIQRMWLELQDRWSYFRL